MKKILYILVLSFTLLTGYSQQSNVVMTTTLSEGEEFSIIAKTKTGNSLIRIDWGNGQTEKFTLGSGYITPINGILKGNTIHIYGEEIAFLDVSYKSLTQLIVYDCPMLSHLSCAGNNLTSLDLSENPLLSELYCYHNQLSTLDLSKNNDLSKLDCSWNTLTHLRLPDNAPITEISCNYNLLTFNTMPIKQARWETFIYSPQASITLPKSVYATGETIDLSRQAIAGGDFTFYSWETEDGFGLVKGVDYSEKNGVFSFLTEQAKPLLCYISNSIFPELMLNTSTLAVPPTPVITMVSSLTEEQFSFSIGTDMGESRILVDWGYGIPTQYVINENTLISGMTEESGTIKISGENITYLNVSEKSLSYLEILDCHTINQLDCSNNNLSALDLRKKPFLSSIVCNNNQLTEMTIDENAPLLELDCSNNELQKINLPQNAPIIFFDCSKNQLTEIVLPKRAPITILNCANNQLITLPLTENPELESLDCSFNPLEKLNLSKNPHLSSLNCSWTLLTEINLSNNPRLAGLTCIGCPLSELNLSKNAALIELNCSRNQLSKLNLSNNPKLSFLDCSDNMLTQLKTKNNAILSELFCFNNQLEELDLSENAALFNLNCSNNQLDELDLSKNSALFNLNCNNNQLMELNLTSNKELSDLDCSFNQIEGLLLHNNRSLSLLNCSWNVLPNLDLSNNTSIAKIDCAGNNIAVLTLPETAPLRTLNCTRNRLTSLIIPEEIKLSALSCYDNLLTFKTLPLAQQIWGAYSYSPQAEILFTSNQSDNQLIDLSNQSDIKDTPTLYTWKNTEGTPLTLNSDYTNFSGIFRFLRDQPEEIYCEMKNELLSNLTLITEKLTVYNTHLPNASSADPISENILFSVPVAPQIPPQSEEDIVALIPEAETNPINEPISESPTTLAEEEPIQPDTTIYTTPKKEKIALWPQIFRKKQKEAKTKPLVSKKNIPQDSVIVKKEKKRPLFFNLTPKETKIKEPKQNKQKASSVIEGIPQQEEIVLPGTFTTPAVNESAAQADKDITQPEKEKKEKKQIWLLKSKKPTDTPPPVIEGIPNN